MPASGWYFRLTIPTQLKAFLLRLVLGLWQVGRWTAKAIAWLSRGLGHLAWPPLGWIGQRLALPGYQLLRRLKRVIASALPTADSVPSGGAVLTVTAIAVSLFSASYQVLAKPVPAELAGQGSLLYQLVGPGEEQFDLSLSQVVGEAPPVVPVELLPQPIPQLPGGQATHGPANASFDQSGLVLLQPVLPPGAPGTRRTIQTYAVQPGDTPAGIAQRFQISLETLLNENRLNEYSIVRPGDQLTILPTSGISHTVRNGDTLGAIALRYGVTTEAIGDFNGLAGDRPLPVGEKLIIPGGRAPTAPAARPSQLAQERQTRLVPPRPSGSRLLWPLPTRRITQYFRFRHPGVDIADSIGTPIYAANPGTVVTAGWNRGGYGYYIIIDHGDGLRTLYGHASKLLVRAGQTVKRGDTIALVGSTGRSTGPHLHFEVIRGGGRVNPLQYTR